jgi:hypothetical protein
MVLLTGVPGSGKTLAIQGFWNRLYAVMAEEVGVSPDELPPRVLRLRAPDVLSKWLGESDKQVARFFDEIEELAAVPFRDRELPLLVICEEIDGLARQRGEDGVHDRIQTTLLQRLDTTSQKLRDQLVVFLFTTNRPGIVDAAFLRRAGGTSEHFGRLDRRAFLAVLGKHLDGRPLAAPRTAVVADLAAFLYAPRGEDQGQVEVSLLGQPAPRRFYRRDFLTGGLVDRAVQQAAAEACRAERAGETPAGLDARRLMRAIDAQVRALADLLAPHNVHDYLTVPDDARVSAVRRIAAPALLSADLERAS